MRLRRSKLNAPGITRRRRGAGFSYHVPDGGRITDPEELTRIRSLVIPPAWKDVWICPWPNGHIQAVGTDAAGRRQYLYHEDWRRSRDAEKHERVLGMARLLPRLRTAIVADLAGRGLLRPRVLAAALRMLDRGVFRTGGEEYAQENGTFGVATLLREHVRVSRGAIDFSYPAKGGVDRSLRLHDPLLARVVSALLRRRAGTGERLLAYHNGTSAWHDVRSVEVNERLKELLGQEFTAKDLRTWHATVYAAVVLAQAGAPRSRRATKRLITAAMREVAEELGNTPAVARKSYVDPRVLALFEEGVLTRQLSEAAAADLSEEAARVEIEEAVARMLLGRAT